MAPYLPVAKSESPSSRLILDEHNVEYLLQERIAAISRTVGRWYSRVQARRLRAYESNALETSDGWIAVSKVDEDFIEPLYPGKPHTVVPIGIDSESHAAKEIPLAPLPRLFFAGKLDYRPNSEALRWFCTHVWPLIPRSGADCGVHHRGLGIRAQSKLAPSAGDTSARLPGR